MAVTKRGWSVPSSLGNSGSINLPLYVYRRIFLRYCANTYVDAQHPHLPFIVIYQLFHRIYHILHILVRQSVVKGQTQDLLRILLRLGT